MSYGSVIVETLLTLAAVSLLAVMLLYGARRAGVGRASGAIDLVGRVPVDARRSIVLVKVAEQVYIVGVSEAGFTKLGELPAKDLPPQPEPKAQGFAEVLRVALGKKPVREPVP